MKFKSEFRIGLVGIITVAVIIWGIGFLKGQNIFRANYQLVARYENVDGLKGSASILLNGFKIGMVRNVEFKTEAKIPFTVILEIDKKYKIKKGSVAEIFSEDLLGTRAVKIVPSDQPDFHIAGDTLKSSISIDMISSLMNNIEPLTTGLSAVIQTLDSAGNAINSIVRDPSIKALLSNLENVSASVDEKFSDSGDISKTLKSLKVISGSLEQQMSSIKTSITNLESVSAELRDAHLDSLIFKLNQTSSSLSDITSAIESGKGTLGKLVYEDSLYRQINLLVTDLDSLVNDLNEHPKKYVSFSLFGKK